jgi:hypothetical protein
MSDGVELLVESYLDGSLDEAGAEALARSLRAGGAESAAVRERVAFAGLLAQALDLADGDAVARAVDERLDAQREGSGFVRAVQRSLPRRRRAHPRTLAPFAIAALLLLSLGVAWWAGRPPAAPTVCVIATADAASLIERQGSSITAAADVGLIADDAVIAHGAVTVRYADGSELSLADGARLRVLGEESRERARLEAGTLEATIAPQPSGHRFALLTREARVEVVGTRFTLLAASGRTRVDLHQGTVRLARLSDDREIALSAGESAEVAPGMELNARGPDAPAPTPILLFPSRGLGGWRQQHGTWSNDGGVVRGVSGNDNARLLSDHPYADLELTCRLRITGVDLAEVQVGDYNWVFAVPAKAGDWIALRLFQRGEELSCTADGVPLRRDRGDGRRARPGPLSFYIRSPGTLEIADARITEPDSSGGSP